MDENIITTSQGEPLRSINALLNTAKRDIVFFAPYIRTETLKSILPASCVNITIITTWKIQDLWYGSSDIDLYPFARDNDYKLFLNNRIHLKAFIVDWQSCIIGSSNITEKGLGISTNCNFELNGAYRHLDHETLLYLRSILADAILVNDVIYNDIALKLKDLPPLPSFPEIKLDSYPSDKDFLISALPMSRSIDVFYELYSNGFNNSNKEAIACAMHDIALYKIPMKLSKAAFMKELKSQFNSSRFIIKLLEFIDDEKYFGRVKDWIHANLLTFPCQVKEI
jgi:phosphatidylserine/phosphatidylglycerophosphate/cardiolipin synthase-like enzyme